MHHTKTAGAGSLVEDNLVPDVRILAVDRTAARPVVGSPGRLAEVSCTGCRDPT